MFIPKAVYYEPDALKYYLGRKLLREYKSKNIPLIKIKNHNNIPEMRAKGNVNFPKMKQNIIIGVRKTHRFVPNKKTSDYLVPYTSSGCIAMCMYCYLVCHYNKCSYLRIFVNREEMLDRIIKKSLSGEKKLTFEIGSNSDLVLENTITGNLEWTIEKFGREGKGYITFPTKFNMVDSLLNLQHNEKTIIRMSVNPQEIITKVEFGTSNLNERIEAINKMCDAGYKVGIIIAPIILVDNWSKLYTELIQELQIKLSHKVKKEAFFEFIFMTYSYVHKMINGEAFPKAIELFDAKLMTGKGMGKYMYKQNVRKEGEVFFREKMKEFFPNNRIEYIV